MIQVCDLSFANNNITDTLGNYSHLTTGNITVGGHTYQTNTDPIVYVTDSSRSCIEFGQTATYSSGAIIQAGIPTYGSKNWSVEFRARVTSAMPDYYGYYEIFYGLPAPYDDNGTARTGGSWSIAINNDLDTLEFGYENHYDYLTIKDELDFTSWHLYKITKTDEEIITLHIDGVLVATIDFEQQVGYESYAVLGSFVLLGVVDDFIESNNVQTNQSVRLADVKVYADPMVHAEKAVSLDNLSRVFRKYNTWLGSQLSGVVGNGTMTVKVNGTTTGTFSANQSTDSEISITVPTKTSDMVNDSDYITSDAVPRFATDGEIDALATDFNTLWGA